MTAKRPKRLSKLEETMALHLRTAGIEFTREVQFCANRKWRFDFVVNGYKLAIECEGGTWAQGRHTRGPGFENDCEKMNAAMILGWSVLRFTEGMIREGYALNATMEWLAKRQ